MSEWCALADRSGARFGVMMGLRVRALEHGRYPSDESSHEGDPLVAMCSPRPDRRPRGRGSGAGFGNRFLDTPQPRGAPGGNAARHVKSRQGYESDFVPVGPNWVESGALSFLWLNEISAPAPKLQIPSARESKTAPELQRDPYRHDPCVVPGHATIPQRSRLNCLSSGADLPGWPTRDRGREILPSRSRRSDEAS